MEHVNNGKIAPPENGYDIDYFIYEQGSTEKLKVNGIPHWKQYPIFKDGDRWVRYSYREEGEFDCYTFPWLNQDCHDVIYFDRFDCSLDPKPEETENHTIGFEV